MACLVKRPMGGDPKALPTLLDRAATVNGVEHSIGPCSGVLHGHQEGLTLTTARFLTLPKAGRAVSSVRREDVVDE
eukprot:811684-Heterocapsa_arctica.AAC.1